MLSQIYNKLSYLIHPILLSLYPVLFLYSYNIEQTAFIEILFPASISLGITLIFLILLTIVFKSKFKSSLFISLLLFLFFSYGHLNEIFFKVIKIRNPDYILIPLYLILLISIGWIIIRTAAELLNITNILNVVTIALFLFSCFSIIKFSIETSKTVIPELDIEKKITTGGSSTKDMPDIYYIILDGYAGEETLKTVYNFDNSEFLNFLRSKGFFVASKSYSNYAHTILSLASSLNLNYVNDLVNTPDDSDRNTALMIKKIENNQIQKLVKENGYMSIHISSRSLYSGRNQYADIVINPTRFNEFLFVLIKSTILSSIFDKLGFSNVLGMGVINSFQMLSRISQDKRLTYTFVHILVPHPPYVFNKTTMPVRYELKDMMGFQWDNRNGYINQLIVVNILLKELIVNIIKNSKTDPIIILQSDHGTASLLESPEKGNWNNPDDFMLKERFNILNALLLPDKIKEIIPNSVSPVNTFRIIFNHLFNTNYPILVNKYYFSPYDKTFMLIDKTVIIKKFIDAK